MLYGAHPQVKILFANIKTIFFFTSLYWCILPIPGELYMIVEYCKYGNLQKYISSKRESFISQINPQTGRYDDQYPPDIDSLLQGHDRYEGEQLLMHLVYLFYPGLGLISLLIFVINLDHT